MKICSNNVLKSVVCLISIQVIALECVLMDAVTLCEAIYKLCDGSEKDESSMIPDDASSECEWKWNVGPGGLLGMEDELRYGISIATVHQYSGYVAKDVSNTM